MTDATRSSAGRISRPTLLAQPSPTAVQSCLAYPKPVAPPIDRFETSTSLSTRDIIREKEGFSTLRVSDSAFQVTDARLLSIDGGGVYGIVPARILQYIEERTGRPIRELFHMVSATSTGSILAAGIAVKLPCKQLVQLYLEDAKIVFQRTSGYKIESGDGWIKPKFKEDGLQSVLKKHIGESRLDEAAMDIVMTAHDLDRGEPRFFESWDSSHQYRMRDIVRASAAAAVFPPALVEDLAHTEKSYLIDGGLTGQTNPVMLGLAEAFSRYPNARRVSAVSLGTGDIPNPIKGADALGWGYARFALPLLGIINSSPTISNDFMARRYLKPGETYFRINPTVRGAGGFDDGSTENMQKLLSETEKYIAANKTQLDALCDALVAEMPSRQAMAGNAS